MSFTEMLWIFLESYILFLIFVVLLALPCALMRKTPSNEAWEDSGQESGPKVLKTRDFTNQGDVEMIDDEHDDEEHDDEEQDDGEQDDEEQGDEDQAYRSLQREFEIKKLEMAMESTDYQKAKQRNFELKKLQKTIESTDSENEKQRAFQLKKVRLNIESSEREKERAFELRKIELENQRLEMEKRLENEKVAIELANNRILVDLKKLEAEGVGGSWTPGTTVEGSSDYELVTNEQDV